MDLHFRKGHSELSSSKDWKRKGLLFRLFLGLLTPVLLFLSFPLPNQGWLAWLALVPLILALKDISPLAAGLIGLLSGIVANIAIGYYLFEVPGVRVYHALILGLYLGLYPALWSALLPVLNQSRGLLLIAAPALWVSLDYLKNHAGFLAFPLTALAHSQQANLPLIQIASITGEYGVTFLVVLGNLALAEILVRRAWTPAGAAFLVIILAHGWGAYQLSEAPQSKSIKVAVVQPSILLSERKTAEGYQGSLDRMERLTVEAAQAGPALIAWPETSVRNLLQDPLLMNRIKKVVDANRISLVVGAAEFNKFERKTGEQGFGLRHSNCAYYFKPMEDLGPPYKKRILLPFGEYLPLESLFSWPEWLIPRMFKNQPGEGPDIFVMPDGTRFANIICWENLFAPFVRDLTLKGARLIVQLTNDNWFGLTSLPFHHTRASIFRAVENRIPVVVANNAGPSLIVDSQGRVVAGLTRLFKTGIIVQEVKIRNGQSFYTRVGDLFALLAIFFLVLVMGTLIAAKKATKYQK